MLFYSKYVLPILVFVFSSLQFQVFDWFKYKHGQYLKSRSGYVFLILLILYSLKESVDEVVDFFGKRWNSFTEYSIK